MRLLPCCIQIGPVTKSVKKTPQKNRKTELAVTANVLKTLSQAVQAQYRNYLSPLFTLKTQAGCAHFMSKESYEYINSAVQVLM